jgi:16S rRNA (guanine966-N2)-methyltransferase
MENGRSGHAHPSRLAHAPASPRTLAARVQGHRVVRVRSAASQQASREESPAMRIVGGEYGGRKLAAPGSDRIRPTTDRTRESLFNILMHAYPEALDGTRVLDLFSGTGALGIEALSRGARFCLFVEGSAEGRGLLRENIDALGLQGRTKIYRRDATGLGALSPLEPFDLVFADPPYGRGLGEKALASAAANGWIVNRALVVLEEKADADIGLPLGFEILDNRSFGDTIIRILRWTSAS